MNSPSPKSQDIAAGTVWLMAISVGTIVANLYYIQPLLVDVAREFNLTSTQAGLIATATQIGTSFGMLFFVPLGDTMERRSLITRLVMAACAALVFTALAPSALWMGIACFGLGLFTAVVHILLPYAAHLAPPEKRGHIVGTVFSGLLLGILLARTFSGVIGAHCGWRSVYWIAAGIMVVMALLIRWRMPVSQPEVKLSYGELLKSLLHFVRKHPELRESAFVGAMIFAGFSAFWTTLVFHLSAPPYHYGSEMAGYFGLVGATGALAASFVGKLADKRGPRATLMIGLYIETASFILMGFLGNSLGGLALGAVVMDLGVQAGHISNQTRIYNLDPHARSRLNTVYMVCYFSGGALGSYGGSLGWHWAQWWGVCGFALIPMVLALGVCLIPQKLKSIRGN
jgi:predicted MFS family arabinose efflux permease